MEPLVEHRLTPAGYETRVLELEGEGPPLLLLHGWADSADTWRLVLDRLARRGPAARSRRPPGVGGARAPARLARRGRRALAVALPGFGAADGLERIGPMLPQLDRFARAAIDYLVED